MQGEHPKAAVINLSLSLSLSLSEAASTTVDGKVEGEELYIASIVFHLGHWMIVIISKNFGQNLLGWIQVQPNSIKIETYMSVSTARWSGTGDTNTLHFGLNRMVN